MSVHSDLEAAPAMGTGSREKMARSTHAPVWAVPLARGRQTVHPVAAPLSTRLLARSVSDGGSSQNLM